jgi:hypothetical protein
MSVADRLFGLEHGLRFRPRARRRPYRGKRLSRFAAEVSRLEDRCLLSNKRETAVVLRHGGLCDGG